MYSCLWSSQQIPARVNKHISSYLSSQQIPARVNKRIWSYLSSQQIPARTNKHILSYLSSQQIPAKVNKRILIIIIHIFYITHYNHNALCTLHAQCFIRICITIFILYELYIHSFIHIHYALQPLYYMHFTHTVTF